MQLSDQPGLPVQVEPFNRALKSLQTDVMINGRRRDHGFERAHIELLEEGSPIKCNPLAWWEFQDCWNYIEGNKLQYHPLHDEVSVAFLAAFSSSQRKAKHCSV